MPTTDDFYQRLVDADQKLDQVNSNLVAVNTNLAAVKTATDAVRAAVNQVNATLNTGFADLVALGTYANLALAQNARQNDTMICVLEHIAKNTCESLNQSALQTALQTDMGKAVAALADMYATAHADAALERNRLQALKAQVEACCPPPRPEPPCKYAACPAPRTLSEPPQIIWRSAIS